jgi:hypothetical protein
LGRVRIQNTSGLEYNSSSVKPNNFETAGLILLKYPSKPAIHMKSAEILKKLSNDNLFLMKLHGLFLVH